MSCQSRYFIFILSFPGPTIDDVNLAIFKVFKKKTQPALLDWIYSKITRRGGDRLGNECQHFANAHYSRY